MSEPAILFVCLGNICRSPMAEAAFRHEAAACNLNVTVDSAGTGDWHIGKPPDARAQAETLRHGIDISGYRARQVRSEDFYSFTHIFALDTANLADLRSNAPADATAQISLLLDHVDAMAGRDVADPYFGEASGFANTWQEVSTAAAALARKFGS